MFNHETNVDLNRRLVCLDLKKLGAGLRTIAMLILQDLVNSQVSMNFLRGIATWCYFDEFHVLLRDRRTASYCVAIGKMLRKKGCVPSALTQNVKDFLASPEIENIFENSDFLVPVSYTHLWTTTCSRYLVSSRKKTILLLEVQPLQGAVVFLDDTR